LISLSRFNTSVRSSPSPLHFFPLSRKSIPIPFLDRRGQIDFSTNGYGVKAANAPAEISTGASDPVALRVS
jgi:hypothetical protein